MPEGNEIHSWAERHTKPFAGRKLHVEMRFPSGTNTKLTRAFPLLLGIPKGACSVVFIAENAHRCGSSTPHLQGKCSMGVHTRHPEEVWMQR